MIYGASSGGLRRQMNTDGTRNVYCWQCGGFISRSVVISRALCAACRLVEEERVMTPEQLRDYHLGKAAQGGEHNVSLLLMPEVTPDQLKGSSRFTFRSMGGAVMKAVGLAKPPKDTVPSAVLARSKRRGRLLENIDLGSLGDMEAVDSKLKEGPGK